MHVVHCCTGCPPPPFSSLPSNAPSCPLPSPPPLPACPPSSEYHVVSVQERLLALSRRARRALEKELQASHQQRGTSTAQLNNRSSGAQPRGEQGLSRDGPRPQEGMRVDRRAGPGELSHARQKELSDRALRILEELGSLGRQVHSSLSKAPATTLAVFLVLLGSSLVF